MPKLTTEMILDAVERDDNSGFCTSCGFEHCGGIEPDARNYKRESCGSLTVFGAEELLLCGAIKQTEVA